MQYRTIWSMNAADQTKINIMNGLWETGDQISTKNCIREDNNEKSFVCMTSLSDLWINMSGRTLADRRPLYCDDTLRLV